MKTQHGTCNEELSVSVARGEAIRLVKHIIDLGEQVFDDEKRLKELIQASRAAPLLKEKDSDPQCRKMPRRLVASRPGCIPRQNCTVSRGGSLPATSGNTVSHRLNRGGDRALNSAPHMVALSKVTHADQTRAYARATC